VNQGQGLLESDNIAVPGPDIFYSKYKVKKEYIGI
jgi:hypothetical protein